MCQGGLTETGRSVEYYVVQCFAPAFGSGDSYIQILLNPILPDEVIKAPGTETGIQWRVLGVGFT